MLVLLVNDCSFSLMILSFSRIISVFASIYLLRSLILVSIFLFLY